MKQVAQAVKVKSGSLEVSNRHRRKSALSLNRNKLQDKDLVVAHEDLSSKPKDVFTETQLIQSWKEYTKRLESKGETSLASILNASQPQLQNQETILLILPTKLMEEQFNASKLPLVQFLRVSFNNYGFKLNTRVDETQKKKYIYSPQEKFEKLVEINPSVLKLKQTFGLDF